MSPPAKIVSRTAILSALAEYLEQSDMVLDLDRELERKMIYGIDLRVSMDAEEIARSLEELLENLPYLIDLERFQEVSEESWGEVASSGAHAQDLSDAWDKGSDQYRRPAQHVHLRPGRESGTGRVEEGIVGTDRRGKESPPRWRTYFSRGGRVNPLGRPT